MRLSPKRYAIKWEYKSQKGIGERVFDTLEEARQCKKKFDEVYPDYKHWIMDLKTLEVVDEVSLA